MEINFTITYTAYFDLDQAEEDFQEMRWRFPEKEIESILYDAVEENITWPMGVDDCPDEVVENAAKALRYRLGGVQLEMDLSELE